MKDIRARAYGKFNLPKDLVDTFKETEECFNAGELNEETIDTFANPGQYEGRPYEACKKRIISHEKAYSACLKAMANRERKFVVGYLKPKRLGFITKGFAVGYRRLFLSKGEPSYFEYLTDGNGCIKQVVFSSFENIHEMSVVDSTCEDLSTIKRYIRLVQDIKEAQKGVDNGNY